MRARILRNSLDFWRGSLEESQLGCPCAFPSPTPLVGPYQWQDPPTHFQILQNSEVSFFTHPPPAVCDEEFVMNQSEFNACPSSPTSPSPCPANVPRTFLQGIKSCVILLERAKNIGKTLPGPCRERKQNSKERLMLAVTWCHCFQCLMTSGLKTRQCGISCSLYLSASWRGLFGLGLVGFVFLLI